MPDILYIVVPCYNEEAVLPETAKRLDLKLKKLIKDKTVSEKSRVMFVNDGSKDKTWEIIKALHKDDGIFTGVNLSRNRGHQNALPAGLMTAKDKANVTISMDADLQDDINAADEILRRMRYRLRRTFKTQNRYFFQKIHRRSILQGYEFFGGRNGI